MLNATRVGHQLKRCSSLEELQRLYASMIKIRANQDCFLMNQFITACSTFHQTNYIILAFSEIKNPNIFVYNAMITGFVHCFSPLDGLFFYIDMLRTQIAPTSYTFSSIIKGCTLGSLSKFGEGVHGQICKTEFASHLYVQTALIDFYSNFGRVAESRQLFDEMPTRDVFAWTTMLSAHARDQDLSSARILFDEMPERNPISWNTMIDGYAKVGDVQSAEFLFDVMPSKDLISWTTMINCYYQNKQYKDALVVFNQMQTEGIKPDEVTMTTIISACAHLGVLDLGKEIHIYVMQNGFNLDVYIGSALIDMYAKCGSLDRSLVIFFKLKEKNLFCWSSIIEGLAVHGHPKAALAMLRMMVKEGIKPNVVTFISILGSCTHAGLVEEGRMMFYKMYHDYSIVPEIEHYGCMVDLLGKAGLLEEALKLINGMTMKPNSVVWGALLSGCKLHKNLEIAQVAVNKLMVLEPENSGYYSLLINMYAEENRWNEVTMIRRTMKELGVEKKCPGSSWIEMDRKIHEFAATGKLHASSSKIYSLLDDLDQQMKLSGSMLECDFPS